MNFLLGVITILITVSKHFSQCIISSVSLLNDPISELSEDKRLVFLALGDFMSSCESNDDDFGAFLVVFKLLILFVFALWNTFLLHFSAHFLSFSSSLSFFFCAKTLN